MAAPVAAAPAKKPRFIENPLPLPKKHVKREMDYDYEVEKMNFMVQHVLIKRHLPDLLNPLILLFLVFPLFVFLV